MPGVSCVHTMPCTAVLAWLSAFNDLLIGAGRGLFSLNNLVQDEGPDFSASSHRSECGTSLDVHWFN